MLLQRCASAPKRCSVALTCRYNASRKQQTLCLRRLLAARTRTQPSIRGIPPGVTRTRKRPRHAALRSRRRPPRYPSRLHNAWTASSRSTRPAVHARSDRWSCLQGCGRAANATRLHAAQLSAATKGCPDPAALSRGSPRSAARGGPAAVATRNGPPAAARRPLVTP